MTPIEEGHEVLAKLGIDRDSQAPSKPAREGHSSLRDQWSSRDADRETEWEKSAPRSKLKYYLAILVVAAGVGAFQTWHLQRQPPLYSAEEEAQNAQVALFLAHAEVEGFRDATGRLPEASDLDWERRLVSYERTGSGFRLTATAETSGDVFIVESGDDLSPLHAAYQELLAEAAN